jgi:curved DNA-binding protein
MEFRDYYQIMGVERDATQDQIKRAYRKLARKFHPDVSKEANAEERFKDVGEAYEVLKDPEKRAAYDQLGSDWSAGQDFQPPPNWDTGFEFSGSGFTAADEAAYSDFFSSLFSQHFGAPGRGGTHAGAHMRGEDHHAKILIDLEDAYKGATRSITLQTPQVDGSGHLVNKQHTLNVKIPQGVKQNQRIRLSGQGGAGLGNGEAGDLYLEIEFRPHVVYRVDGRDVYLDLPITPWEAALGAIVKAPTPDGLVDLTIPAGADSENTLRLKGRGIPGKPPGNLYVRPKITVPPADSDSAKDLFKKMEQELPYNPRSKLGV